MNQDFDYFLLLSALAVVFVIWLLIRTLKNKETDHKQPTQSGPSPAKRRIERVRHRVSDHTNSQTEIPKIKLSRVICICFYTVDDVPFASLRLSSVAAQSWGDKVTVLTDNLNCFCKRFLSPEDNEALLIHIARSFPPDTVLKTKAFNEKGESVGDFQPSGLQVKDFPSYCEVSITEIKAWLMNMLLSQYRGLFYQCSASQQAYLIKNENSLSLESNKQNFEEVAAAAYAHLLLINILKKPNFYEQSFLWNHYWLLVQSENFPYTETLKRLERLVISQTFVQTQKLPFLLIQTPKDSGKCHNALNY